MNLLFRKERLRLTDQFCLYPVLFFQRHQLFDHAVRDHDAVDGPPFRSPGFDLAREAERQRAFYERRGFQIIVVRFEPSTS